MCDNPVLCLINISDHYVEVEKGEVLAYAEEVCSNVETIRVQKVEVAEQGGLENGKREIPEHLINLFDKSKGELNEQEQTQLSELLHLFCIGQNFPFLYFYIVIGYVNQTKHWVITPIVQCSRY
jgi:hypothetical protein